MDSFDSFHHFLYKSDCSKFSFDFCLNQQITVSEVDILIRKHIWSFSVSSLSKSIQLKASAWGIYSSGGFFNSHLKPIRGFVHLLILSDAVFAISSSGAEIYLNGLLAVCRLSHFLRRNCFNPVITETIAIASRSLFEEFCSTGVKFSRYIYNRISFLRENPTNSFFRGVSCKCCFLL